MVEVGATTRVRDLGGVDQCRQLAFLGIDHGDLVGRVGGHEEVALARSQPPSCRNLAELIVTSFRLAMSE
jgi:hypothetical protein